ncbi:unnamed protein product [Linum trigynum]|uniref:Kinesin motor domain-containing protein n=1 Tax=Linum trigynum TaxID=586398 RepID=A0AAV2EIM0_9ROSI
MERIHVTVRARPLQPDDAKSSPWRISGNSVFIPNHSTKFEFDRVFGEESRTEEIYKARTRDIVTAAIRGFNGTVFAYGQTNSGKTHTMRGSATELGVIPLAVHDVFDIINEHVDREFLLRMSYMEIYNEDINDLLAPEHRKLQIHENLERGIYVAGLREEIVTSPQQVLDRMQFGEAHRHIGETNMNVYSSRSHTIFRMIIESRDRTEDEDRGNACDAVRVSVLNLVDLAGSERAAKTGAEGVRLKEGSHINKSLMTLGTVIKKLSEGAESQGGHVPYRDSKLTRILQPALGGNANTAIICNITLAQIHADETKSSLQFASRALRVQNCACVNEVLTDAALLKRQKKEIEELRAKLQGSHSEHFEEEILNLRNTLLKSELERERVTLELEEEKRVQAEREKLLQEQAKRIENLSSMVLYSSRDDNCNQLKKGKRRDTWCPSNFSRVILQEVDANAQSRLSSVEPMPVRRNEGALVSFEELVSDQKGADDLCPQQEVAKDNAVEDCTPPDPCSLLHVTNRRKVLPRKKASASEDHELRAVQAEYEELLVESETQRTVSDVMIDSLRRQLVNSDNSHVRNQCDLSFSHGTETMNCKDKSISIRESEAIVVIKQLQEKIEMLEMDKDSSQQNLDSVVELATEQSLYAREKFEELCQELEKAREEAKVAREQLESAGHVGEINKQLQVEIEEIVREVQEAKDTVQSTFSLLDEALQSFSMESDMFHELRNSVLENNEKQKLVISNHAEICGSIRHKLTVVEKEKLLLSNKCSDLERRLQEMMQDAQNHEDALTKISEEANIEKEEYRSYIHILEKEIHQLSSCALAKEKESLRKDLEKARTKLKETESKFKNVIQEKTKLEGEKKLAEKEVKRLHGQKSLLERDISKRDSFADRRRDSVFDRSSKTCDTRKQAMEDDYRKLEVLAFEMEATIASLEEELAEVRKEKEEATQRSEGLASDLESLTEKLSASDAELWALQQEIFELRMKLEACTSERQETQSTIELLIKEKEELAMQFSDSLLEMEEEKAIWLSKEKASLQAIEEKGKLYNEEISALYKTMSEVQDELDSCREECKVLKETLLREENRQLDKCSNNASQDSESESERHGMLQIEQSDPSVPNDGENPTTAVRDIDADKKQLIGELENLKNQLDVVMKEKEMLMAQMQDYHKNTAEAEFVKQHYDDMLKVARAQIDQLSGSIASLEAKMQTDYVANCNEKAKLKMMVRGTQAKSEALCFRLGQSVRENDVMHKKFKEASKELKEKLATCGMENLNLKKQLASSSIN